MKPIPDDLLHDTLDDAAPDSFSASALSSVLTHLQRKKVVRRRLKIASIACVLTAFVLLAFLTMSPPSRVVTAPVATVKPVAVEIQNTIAAAPPVPVAVVSKHPPIHDITDEELLAFFPNQAAGFIGTGDHREFFVASHERRGNKIR